MIRCITFMNMMESRRTATFGGGRPTTVNVWLLLRKCLEESDDTLIWVVTRQQHPAFLEMMKKYDLRSSASLSTCRLLGWSMTGFGSVT
jgi:folate-binding Fe-S cluster repair protein YgfZ